MSTPKSRKLSLRARSTVKNVVDPISFSTRSGVRNDIGSNTPGEPGDREVDLRDRAPNFVVRQYRAHQVGGLSSLTPLRPRLMVSITLLTMFYVIYRC